MSTYLITGANRGIGLELVRQLKARGEDIIATCRSASSELNALSVRVETNIDITSGDSVIKLRENLNDTKVDVLIQNAGKHLSKEELTALVWKERYNPLVHDTRIYSAIRRLRALLGPLKKFIVTGAGTYQMNSGLNFCLMEPIDRRSDLTDKQNWILSYAEKNGTIDRKTVQETLRIGSTSSKSELNRLVEIGLLRKKGDGRSTSYHTL